MQRLRIAISCFTLVGVVCLSLFVHQAFFKPTPAAETSSASLEYATGQDSTNSVAGSANPSQGTQEFVPETAELAQFGSSDRVAETDFELVNSVGKQIELTNFRGDMKKGKLAKRPWVDLSTHPSLPWFTKDASRIVFPDSDESSDRDYFYAWIQLNPNHLHTISHDTFQTLQVEIYDGGNEYRRVRLPREKEKLEKLLEHEAVLALGNKPISEKIGPNFQEEIDTSIGSESKEVFITLMTTSNLQHWQQQIEKLGAVIDHWDPTIRVLVAKVPYGKLVDLAEWDFIQAVEPVGTLDLSLDSAVPVSGADGIRTHLGVNGSFTGITGDGITIGVIDSGLNLSHPDISSTRDSICGESFQTMGNGLLDTDDLWVDVVGHGTHVTSIFAGAGVDDRSRAGVAPGVKHIRFAKAFAKTSGGASTTSMLKAFDYLTEESSCEWNGTQSAAMKPNVINMSLSSITADTGYRVGAKKLDWAAWNHDQVFAVSMGNARTIGYSQYGSAKNSIAVAWFADTLFADYSSSIGPASDGRMIPNVGMSGDRVLAADGDGATSGYALKSGTSMSSPAVAGIAALLMGTDDGFKTNPALVRAQLMATAIKADAFFEDEAYAPRTNTHGTGYINDQYGMGAVSARTAITQGPDGAWSSHSVVSEIENDEYAYIEIEIPADTDRVDIVLTWDEPPNDNVGSAVMADLDLYLGPDEDCDVTECGEYVSSSRVDNMEYLIISNPEAGTKRITVIPHNIFQFAPKIAVSWMIIADSTPQLDIELDSDTLNTANTRRPQLDLTVSSDGFVAGGVSLYFACRNQGDGDCDYWYDRDESRWQPGSQITREDGTVQDLTGIYIRDPVFIGELVSGEVQDVTLVFPPAMKTDSHQLYVSAASANAFYDVDAVNVIVDNNTDLPTLSTAILNAYATTAIELAGDSGTISVDLAAGARQPGERAIDDEVLYTFFTTRGWSPGLYLLITEGYWQSRSAWYKLSATTAAKYGIQITSQDPDDANVTFQLLAADDMFEPPAGNMWTTDLHEFYLQPDTDYYLRVNTYWTIRVPELEFTWQKLDTKPVNDDFADRSQISGISGDVSGNNAYATVERGEPGGHVSVGSTWFKWTAPSTGVWTFEAEATYFDDSPQVLVYLGDSVGNLRLVSDPSFFEATVPVVENQEYQICVSSDAQFTDFQGSYELSWEEGESEDLMPNDMFSNAASISGPQGSRTKCNPCFGVARTIEEGEPTATTSHSLWWVWEAPSSNQFTFRIQNAQVDTLSVFTGSSLSTLSLVETGPEFVLDATSDTTYYIALHRNSGLEYTFDSSNNTFQWGRTPEGDSIISPLTLTGSTGSTSLALKYATTTPDESRANGVTSAGVHSSVWGTWTAPGGFENWMKFSTETWEDAELQRATDQYFLAIHERDEANNKWDLVTSTDRSFIISGKPEAIFKPTEGTAYRIQVALRSNTTALSTRQAEIDVSWEPTDIPHWITSDLHFYEIGSPIDNNIEELIDPISGVLAGRDLNKLLLTLEDEMLVLGLSGDENDLNVIETIPYEDADEETVEISDLSVIAWNEKRRTLYVPAENGFKIFEGLDQSDREVSNCNVDDDWQLDTNQVLQDGTGRFIYKIGEDTIAAYRVDGPCEITLLQVATASLRPHSLKDQLLDLDGLQSATFDPGQSRIYGMSEDRLFTFSRDIERGTLHVASDTLHSDWLTRVGVDEDSDRFDGASLVVDATGNYLFAVGRRNPSIAVFNLTANRDSPTAVGAVENYYIDYFQFFPTHIRRPRTRWDEGQCQISSVHRTRQPTIEVFCRFMNFVATYDATEGELYISDWSSDEQPDRYGNQLPVFNDLDDAFGFSTINGQYSYVVVDDWIDSIHRFERVTGESTLPRPEDQLESYDRYIVRLVAMDVEVNSIKLGSRTFNECTEFNSFDIDGVSYTVHSSEWQVRQDTDDDGVEEWTQVSGQARTDNQLCPYAPDNDGDYRLVFDAEIDIDDVENEEPRGYYSSDVLTVNTSSN
ncbi:MAG: S8 family peptidase [Gammaproteobacteria bacterium]|nr:S8 family peptidase [Gammaproteobacteria bacterium]